MVFIKRITKHGNSAGIILERALLNLMGWDVGTEVQIQVTDDAIVLKRRLTYGRRSTDKPAEK